MRIISYIDVCKEVLLGLGYPNPSPNLTLTQP